MNNFTHAKQLHDAANAVMTLQAQGRKVLGYHFNGQGPVLLADARPGNGQGLTCLTEPDGKGGRVRRYTTRVAGVRVEWQEQDEPIAEVANG